MGDDYNTYVLHLIQAHLEIGVPSEIHRIERNGGITPADFERVRGHALYIGAHGDAILYHTKGQTAPAMTRLIEGIAVLSYSPGGITTFGLHFDGQAIAPSYHEMAQAQQATCTGEE